MDTLMQLVTKGNDFLWSFLLLVLLCGTGLYYTIRLRFIQVRKFGEGVRQVFGHFSMNGEKHEKGEMTPFQSIATAIAAQVGTGNLAGAATALIGGGPGAVFWMWISAFLGMATIYGEAVLAQTYKTEVNGEVTGGPVYYIKAAFKGIFGKALSTLFAVFIILALGFMGNMVQSNSIGAAFVEAFQVFHVELSPVIVGIVVAVIAAVIFLGGTKSLATVVEKIVPIMAGVYIVGSLVLICMNITALPAAFLSIIEGAFAPEAVLGAGAGITVREAIRYGVARGPHALKACRNDLRSAVPAGKTMDCNAVHRLKTFYHAVLDRIELIDLCIMICINHLCCKSETCASRNILGAGAHAFLLSASVDDRFDLYLLINIQEAGSLRAVDLMSAG